LGFFYFADQIPGKNLNKDTETDAIVVLTGGIMRLEEGLNAFVGIKAKKILISGVGTGFTKKILLKKILKQQLLDQINIDNIILGNIASNTFENAIETKLFLDLNHFKSLRLVTSNYHIPRSLLLFRRIMPEIIIIPHPVCVGGFKKSANYITLYNLKIIINEYNKTLWLLTNNAIDDMGEIWNTIIMKAFSLIRPIHVEKDQTPVE
jgi:uncharacterized SAM-binding protein YcdF (DUF218 family)